MIEIPQLNYKVLQGFDTLNPVTKKTIAKELRTFLRKHERYELATELYRYFRIPPVIITKEKEILFTEDQE